MKSKQIVLTLGYIAIFCVALYFVFGIITNKWTWIN